MTDRGRGALRRSHDALTIGPTALRWTGGTLEIDVDEMGSPPRIGRIRGRITVTPAAVTSVELVLSPSGNHVWRPFAPASRIAVDLEGAGWTWEGAGYLDGNFGDRPIDRDFAHWTWGRFPTPDGGATCFYDATRRDGTTLENALHFGPDGHAAAVDAPPRAPMPPSGWRIRRETRADPGTAPRQVRSLLDAPFYSRSVVETVVGGARLTGVHEAIDLDRFASPFVKPLLAFRVPRRPSWRFAQA